MNNLFRIALGFFILELLIVADVVYMIVSPPTQFKLTAPLKVTVATVPQGGNVPLEIDYCKYTDTIPLTYFTMVDHDLLPAIPAELALEKGCHKQLYRLNVAFSVPTGMYRISMTKQYPYFVFAGKTQTFFSNYFEVTAATDEVAK